MCSSRSLIVAIKNVAWSTAVSRSSGSVWLDEGYLGRKESHMLLISCICRFRHSMLTVGLLCRKYWIAFNHVDEHYSMLLSSKDSIFLRFWIPNWSEHQHAWTWITHLCLVKLYSERLQTMEKKVFKTLLVASGCTPPNTSFPCLQTLSVFLS